METTIAPAGKTDCRTLLSMMRKLYSGEGFEFPAGSAAALKLLLSKPHYGRCFIIRRGRRAAGYFVVAFGFSLEFGGADAFLDELYIEPASRGQGLGRLAVEHAAGFCKSKGIHALHLEVSRANRPAQRLYRTAGFGPRHRGYDLLTLRMDGTRRPPARRAGGFKGMGLRSGCS